jgi:glycosyltransferase involved in cell wall biosynthesis
MNQLLAGSHKVAIIIPVFNDWRCISSLLLRLDRQLFSASQISEATVFIVDDGSTCPFDLNCNLNYRAFTSISIIHLGCNLGHQRAIAVGISEVVASHECDAIMILDSDGEDRPEDAVILFSEWLRNPLSIVVAKRTKRNEGFVFQMFYRTYLKLFRILSGYHLNFGNFAVLSCHNAAKLAYMPELWNHFAASVLRSKSPLVRIPIAKGSREFGDSRMNFIGLINHGLASASVLIDVVFARLLIASSFSAAVLVLAAFYVLYQKLFTHYAIPGWASSMVAFSLLGLLQIFALVFVVTFLILSSRSTLQRPTLHLAREYIQSVQSFPFT